MFVPVACSQCGKPFQVPEPAVGKPAGCPWCQAVVLALPVGRAPDPQPPQPVPEPLPLDDAPEEPPARRFPWAVVGLGVAALVAATGLTLAVLHFTRTVPKEAPPQLDWQTFTPPDESVSVDLFETVTQETATGVGAKRFHSEDADVGLAAWVGWAELTPVEIQAAGTDDAWKHFGKAFDAERDRLKAKYAGTVTREATTRFKDPLTREVRMDTPGGKLLVRMTVMPNGPRPRLYSVGMAGWFDPDGPEAKRLFESFRVKG